VLPINQLAVFNYLGLVAAKRQSIKEEDSDSCIGKEISCKVLGNAQK
jgi:hypothetical protein